VVGGRLSETQQNTLRVRAGHCGFDESELGNHGVAVVRGVVGEEPVWILRVNSDGEQSTFPLVEHLAGDVQHGVVTDGATVVDPDSPILGGDIGDLAPGD